MDTKDNNRRRVALYISIVLLVIVVAAGLTFAFFSPNVSTNDGDIDVDVTTSDSVEIVFENGSDLDLEALEPGMNDTSYFHITMTSDGSNVSGAYNITLSIDENTFVCPNNTCDVNTRELSYEFYSSASQNGPWGNAISSGELAGASGDITLAANELISACASANNCASSVTKYYKLVVTYPNLPKDQSYNMEKELHGTIEFSEAQ